MSSDPDVTRAVRSWLREGADRLPERVLDSVLDAVPSTPQRRPWWPAWRFQIMSTAARAGLGAALVAGALLVVGGMLAIGGGGAPTAVTPTPGPTIAPAASPTGVATAAPTAAATASPIATPTASPDSVIDSPRDIGAQVPAGTYRVAGPFQAPYTVTLPKGYQNRALEAGEASFVSAQGYLNVLIPEAVFADPCKPDVLVPASTVDEFVTALSSMKGFKAEDVSKTTVGGRPATTFVLKNAIDTDAAGCTRRGQLPMFTLAGHPDGASTTGGLDELFYVVDVDGTPVFVILDQWASPAALEELKSIAEGITFE